MYEDNPRMHLEDLLESALFPNSTLGWNIAGPRDVIRTVPREKLIAYRDAYYVPSRLTIAIAGKIQPGVFRLLEKTFGSVKEPSLPRDRSFKVFDLPKRLTKPLALQNKQTEQVQIGMAFHGLPLGHKDLPAASLLAPGAGRHGDLRHHGLTRQETREGSPHDHQSGIEEGRLLRRHGRRTPPRERPRARETHARVRRFVVPGRLVRETVDVPEGA